jgi:hypothetical protein
MLRNIAAGAAAGAAGTTALHAVTYADMAWRGRPASTIPEQSVDKMANQAGHPVPGTGAERENRLTGLGALSGLATGVGIGAVIGALGRRLHPLLGGALVGAAAMTATNASLVRQGLTDPRKWSRADWLSDAFPHLAYGMVTSATLNAIRGNR